MRLSNAGSNFANHLFLFHLQTIHVQLKHPLQFRHLQVCTLNKLYICQFGFFYLPPSLQIIPAPFCKVLVPNCLFVFFFFKFNFHFLFLIFHAEEDWATWKLCLSANSRQMGGNDQEITFWEQSEQVLCLCLFGNNPRAGSMGISPRKRGTSYPQGEC